MDDEQRKRIYERVYKPGFGGSDASEAIARRRDKAQMMRQDQGLLQASDSPSLLDVIKNKFTKPGLGEADMALDRKRRGLIAP